MSGLRKIAQEFGLTVSDGKITRVYKKANSTRSRCKYCGAVLKKDSVGKYCPTKNCQWQHGVTDNQPTP